MRFVQLLLTDDQAAKLKVSADMILEDDKYLLTEEEQADYERLSVFFGQVVAHPEAFTPEGKMAKTVKQITRSARGPAQPQSRRNRRKARQEKRIGFSKRRRAERREFAEAYNAAVAQVEADRVEMEAAHAEFLAKIESEPKFNVVDMTGHVLMAGVPSSMVVPVELADFVPTPEVRGEAPNIVLPGKFEKAQEREAT